MNGAHLHLILNHLPIAGVFFGAIVLILSRWTRNEAIVRTGLLLIALTGLLTIATYLTGEPAEKVVEHLPGITEEMINSHEEAAEKSAWVVCIASSLSLIGLGLSFKRELAPRSLVLLVLFLSLVSLGLLGWSNNLGGRIMHQEIRVK